ncbi:MAG: BMP family ABC transporter substrate-binding protein [Desulfurococcaceae archaeon]
MLSTKALVAIVVVIAIVAGLVGYYIASLRGAPPQTTTAMPVKIAFIFPGSVTDTAWNEAGYRSMEAFLGQHPGLVSAWVQGVYDPTQIISVAQSYISQGYNLIIGVGFQFGAPFAQIANSTSLPPNVYFLAIAGAPQYVGPRVSGANIRTDQACFVEGYVGILMSKTKKIGYVAGMNVSELALCEIGLRSGIKYAGYDPDKVLYVVYTGDFHDVAKAKLATETLITQYGVDVIKSMGDGVQLGAIAAVKEHPGVLIMTSSTYHPELVGEQLLLAEVWDWSAVYNAFYNDYLNGTLAHGGKYYWADMANGGIKLIQGSACPNDVWNNIQGLISEVASGKISTGFTP